MKLTISKPQSFIRSAVTKYKDFIAPTYGPAGKKILIVLNEFNQEAVDDGKRSSQAFELENEFENAIVQYIKETTQKGKDGTTTAGLIMSSLVLEALKYSDDELGDSDYHGMAEGLKKGLNEAIKQLTKSSKKIKTKEEMYAIAYNSYNNEKIAKLVADTIFEIGKDGVLSIEDSKSTETSVEIVNGLEIQKGYFSPYFINQDDKVVLNNPQILLVNKKVNLFAELVPILKQMQQASLRDFVLVAEGFGDDVVNKCIAQKFMGGLMPLLIETPGVGDRLENLSDMAIIVGARVVDEKLLKLQDVKLEHLGTCDVIKSTKDKTTILGGSGKTKEYVDDLKSRLQGDKSDFERDKLNRRIAVLLGGVAVIKVGAYTENEQKGIKTKVENAVNSTQIAFKGGVVEGAGKSLEKLETSSNLLNYALKSPRLQLEDNGKKYLDEGTVDPTDVVITALESAVSIATGLITLGGISVPKRKKEKEESF